MNPLFFYEEHLDKKLLSAFEVGGSKAFKSKFYRRIYSYKFFMIKRKNNSDFKSIELVHFIHDEQEKRLRLEKPPKEKRHFNCKLKKSVC